MQTTAPDEIGELLAEQGFDGPADALRVLLDEVMKLERADVLGAGPSPRRDDRKGYADGVTPKTVQARVGALTLAVPQARGVEFYPSALEEGLRSERALKLAVAEKHVQGVSTRKVAAVAEGLAVFAVPRSHRRRLRTSNMLERLNEELKCRTRLAGLFPNDASLLRLVGAVLMEAY